MLLQSLKPLGMGFKGLAYLIPASLSAVWSTLKGGAKPMRYAVVQTGGKQYRVSEGQELFVEKLGAEEGTTVELEDVLLVVEDGKVNTGNPFVDGAKVVATVVKNGKSPKVVVFKYKPKKNYRRKYGHRQPYTKLRIEQIVG